MYGCRGAATQRLNVTAMGVSSIPTRDNKLFAFLFSDNTMTTMPNDDVHPI